MVALFQLGHQTSFIFQLSLMGQAGCSLAFSIGCFPPALQVGGSSHTVAITGKYTQNLQKKQIFATYLFVFDLYLFIG